MHAFALGCLVLLSATGMAPAGRPNQKREDASYVFSGQVRAMYVAGAKEYKAYIVELKVEEITKGDRLKKGDIFRAFCYQNKAPEPFQTRGHSKVPEVGQHIRVYVNDARGHNEGVYPDWFDVLPNPKK
jgi:hypothetical protein